MVNRILMLANRAVAIIESFIILGKDALFPAGIPPGLFHHIVVMPQPNGRGDKCIQQQ